MKKIIMLLVVVFLFVVPFTIFPEGNKENASEVGKSGIKLGLITYPYKIQWMEAYDAGFTWYCEDHGINYVVQKPEALTTDAQINACRSLLLSGVDGIIVTPISDAAGNEIVRLAKEKNVPVMTTNVDVDNPDVVMSVSFSSSEAGKICGENIVNYLKEKYGKPKGNVLVMWFMPGNIQNRKRYEGFKKVVSQYKEIDIFTQMIKAGQPSEAKKGTLAAFRGGRKFDAYMVSIVGVAKEQS